MKKVLSVILILATLFSLCACEIDDIPQTTGNTGSVSETNNTPGELETDTPTEDATDAPTEKETDAPTEAETEAPTQKETDAPTEPPTHKHRYSAATCLKPQTCYECEATLGEALGHDWKAATCQKPKTCARCDATGGLAASHDYVGGTCTHCGLSDSRYESSIMVWIPTKGGKKYHTHAGCSNMNDPDYVTLEEAEELGFTPCKRCH